MRTDYGTMYFNVGNPGLSDKWILWGKDEDGDINLGHIQVNTIKGIKRWTFNTNGKLCFAYSELLSILHFVDQLEMAFPSHTIVSQESPK